MSTSSGISRRRFLRNSTWAATGLLFGSGASPGVQRDRKALLSELRTPHKIPRFVIPPSLKEGTFDRWSADAPFPYWHDDRYYMTYVGFDGIGYRTGWATSDDLIHWTKHGLLIDRGPKGSVTEFNIAMTSIIRDNELYGRGELRNIDGRYVGTYHAYPRPGRETGPAVIGLCFSKDLRRWELAPPILRPDEGKAWEHSGLYKSWLLEHEGTYYLFYNAKNKPRQWNEQIGVAVSPDLKRWERPEGNPVLPNGGPGSFDERFCSDPCVFRHRGLWVMFYFGLSGKDHHARDSVAISEDLLHWEKSNEILVDVGPPGSIDSLHAHKPAMIARDGTLYHFYCAKSPGGPKENRGGKWQGISVARS